MSFQEITSFIFLVLAALSSCSPVENYHEARRVSKAPTCKKATMFHQISRPRPGTKLPIKSIKSPSGNYKRKSSNSFDAERSKTDDMDSISDDSKRAIVTFKMNGPAEGAPLTCAGDALHTHSLGGCSVVSMFSIIFAVGVHVSQGILGQNDRAAISRNAMSKLMSIYHAKADRTQPVKVLENTMPSPHPNLL